MPRFQTWQQVGESRDHVCWCVLPGKLVLGHLLLLALGDLGLKLAPGGQAGCQLSIPLGILLCQGSLNHAVPLCRVHLLLGQQSLQMLPEQSAKSVVKCVLSREMTAS